MDHKISIIIPAKNEAGSIGDIVKKCLNFGEVIVVDGYSIDETRQIAQKCGAKVILDNKKSKGDAIRVGAKHASGDILVFIDADGSHEPADIPKLAEQIVRGKADMVIASRMLGGSDELYGKFDQFIRNIGSGLIVVLVNLRFKSNLTDIENGFRAIKKDVFFALNLKRNDFIIEQEMVMKCFKKGYHILEEASHEYERKAGVSKLATSQGWKFIWHAFITLITP